MAISNDKILILKFEHEGMKDLYKILNKKINNKEISIIGIIKDFLTNEETFN